jgi:hypothetical protein
MPAVLLGALILMVAHAVRFSMAGWGAGGFAVFFSAFLLASRVASLRSLPVETARGGQGLGGGGLPRLLARFDRGRPRWLGVWACGERCRRLTLLWAVSLVLLGGMAGVVSLVQHWPWPSVVASVVGGHGFFLTALDTRPLLSTALRSQPLAYGRAVAGVVRLPLCASLAWFAVAFLPGLPGGIALLPAAALSLLVLDLYFTACLCIVSASRRQGLVLYAVGALAILQQAAEYGMAYGWLVAGVVLAIAGFLVSRARRRFRAHA